MVSACNIEDVPSYGGSAFSDIVGGTNASYTGFSQIGGSKKRRRTKRKRGKRTKHCRCKICKCKKCRCDKKHNKIGGGSFNYGDYARSSEDVMRLYNEAMEKERSEKAFDDAERQLVSLRKEGVDASRDTDIMEYVKKISDKESPNRKSSPRRNSPRRNSPRRSIPKRTNNRPKRTNSRFKIDTDERARKHSKLLKQLGLSTDRQIGEYIDKPKKSVKKREFKDKNIISEVRPINKALDYELTGNKFKIVNVGADGNCFFRSISHLIFGNENRHDIIRKSMVKWVHENRTKLIDKNIVSSGGSEDTGHSIPFCWAFQGQLLEIHRVSREDKKFLRKIEPRRNSNYYNIKDQNRLIDIYCKTMGTSGVWAQGKLEFYFICNALNKYHNEKIRMILYSFPCPKNPSNEGKDVRNRGDPCLEYIPSLGRHVREFCTISIQDPVTTIFNRGEPRLKDIHLLNMEDLHYTALELLP